MTPIFCVPVGVAALGAAVVAAGAEATLVCAAAATENTSATAMNVAANLRFMMLVNSSKIRSGFDFLFENLYPRPESLISPRVGPERANARMPMTFRLWIPLIIANGG